MGIHFCCLFSVYNIYIYRYRVSRFLVLSLSAFLLRCCSASLFFCLSALFSSSFLLAHGGGGWLLPTPLLILLSICIVVDFLAYCQSVLVVDDDSCWRQLKGFGVAEVCCLVGQIPRMLRISYRQEAPRHGMQLHILKFRDGVQNHANPKGNGSQQEMNKKTPKRKDKRPPHTFIPGAWIASEISGGKGAIKEDVEANSKLSTCATWRLNHCAKGRKKWLGEFHCHGISISVYSNLNGMWRILGWVNCFVEPGWQHRVFFFVLKPSRKSCCTHGFLVWRKLLLRSVQSHAWCTPRMYSTDAHSKLNCVISGCFGSYFEPQRSCPSLVKKVQGKLCEWREL